MLTNSVVTNFIKDFAQSQGVDPTLMVSIKIDVNKGVKYSYVEIPKGVVHTVEDLSEWDS